MSSACNRCHHRKSRCDKQFPTCGPCQKAGVECKYVDRTKYRQQHIERLQSRLKQMEATNRRLETRLAATPNLQSTPATDAESGVECDEGHSNVVESPVRNEDAVHHGADTAEPLDDEIIEEISFLSSRAGGERNFLGSASGVLLANLVSATVTSPRDRGHSKKRYSGDRQLHRQTSNTFAGTNETLPANTTGSVDVASLPPERTARELLRSYFENDHLCYPFLHKQTVFTFFDRAYTNAMFLSQNAFAYYIFHMIIAIAAAGGQKLDLEGVPDAESYQLRAMQRLDEVLREGGIQALQALLLLFRYRMINSTQDTSASMWHIVGIAARMCFELGLHREQTYWPINNATPEQLISNEILRRCFWCTVAMDRIVSITLGRPLAIYLHDTDVNLPTPNLEVLVHQTSRTFGSPTDPTFSQTQIFNHIVRYRVICGDILTAFHNGSSRTVADEAARLVTRTNLSQQLEEWHKSTEELSLPNVDSSNQLVENRSSFLALEWYEMLYHNARLLLYRPSPALPSISSQDATVLQNIFMSAKHAIRLYSQLHRSRRINYTWLTLHSIFMAGLSYIYAVGQHFRLAKQGNTAGRGVASTGSLQKDPTVLEIANDSRACSNLLVALSEQWNVKKHCHDVFNRLSDAVLSDAIEYHSRKHDETSVGASHTLTQDSNRRSLRTWQMDTEANSAMGVDSVLYECFDDLRQSELYMAGNDPVCQLFHEWLGEIGGIYINQPAVWQ